jgi:hypothetical protein
MLKVAFYFNFYSILVAKPVYFILLVQSEKSEIIEFSDMGKIYFSRVNNLPNRRGRLQDGFYAEAAANATT